MTDGHAEEQAANAYDTAHYRSVARSRKNHLINGPEKTRSQLGCCYVWPRDRHHGTSDSGHIVRRRTIIIFHDVLLICDNGCIPRANQNARTPYQTAVIA